MSVGMFVSTSTLRLIGMPRSSAFWIGGIPWPICISIGPATEKPPPVSAIRSSSSSVSVHEWMYVVSCPRPRCPPAASASDELLHEPGPVGADADMRGDPRLDVGMTGGVPLGDGEGHARRTAVRPRRARASAAGPPTRSTGSGAGRCRSDRGWSRDSGGRSSGRSRRRRGSPTRCSASITASVCWGVVLMCDQSRMVVTPEFIAE